MHSNNITVKKITLVETDPTNEPNFICKKSTKNHRGLKENHESKFNLDDCLPNNQIKSNFPTDGNEKPVVNVNISN